MSTLGLGSSVLRLIDDVLHPTSAVIIESSYNKEIKVHDKSNPLIISSNDLRSFSSTTLSKRREEDTIMTNICVGHTSFEGLQS